MSLILAMYGLACLWLCWQWLVIPMRPSQQTSAAWPNDLRLSVIVPVRNEAENIIFLLNDLLYQTLPHKYFEVIVADDASTDDTAPIVRQFQKDNPLSVILLSLPNTPTQAPKKRAISAALEVATGQWIITTDGDCRVGPKWLETIAHTCLQTKAQFISGPVTFLKKSNLKWYSKAWEIFQRIEFSSLIGTGACLLEAGIPTMCNGANLIYSRTAFDQVGGYEGIDHIASGDDELLLQKIAKRYPKDIYFLKNPEAIVLTYAQPDWPSFYQQRIRWASKWSANRRWATILVAVFIFLANVITLVWVLGSIFGLLDCNGLLLLKFLPEFLFLGLMVRFLGFKKQIIWIPVVQFIYPFYVLFFGLAAQQKKYEWKGRKLR